MAKRIIKEDVEKLLDIKEDDALIVFQNEGFGIYLPKRYQDLPDQKLPGYVIMAAAVATALADDLMSDYILQWFRDTMQEDGESFRHPTINPSSDAIN